MERAVADVYEFESILGEGAFSSVVLGTHNETKKQYAIKIIDKERIESEVQRERVQREISILKTCSHPNILKLIETYESDLEISLVVELMQGGDLFDRITSKGVFTEEEARTAMYNIMSAVDYLHDRSIVHRDLKPENLLYSSMEESATIKISDFGLSKYAVDSDGLITPCGTIAYTAPEVTNNKVYRKGVDIWSCGCILYFMLFGRPPFYSSEEEEIYDLVSEGKYYFPENSLVSDSAREMIGYLLEKDPRSRYTAKQALLHPWMTGRTSRLRESTTPPPNVRTEASAPMAIPNLRGSFNSAMEALRGPLTPPFGSPMESTLRKKRAAKLRSNTGLVLSKPNAEYDEPDLSSDSDTDQRPLRDFDDDDSDDVDDDGVDEDEDDAMDDDDDDDVDSRDVEDVGSDDEEMEIDILRP